MSAFRVLGKVVFGLLTAVLAGLVLGLTVLPSLVGYRTYVVVSGSMEPAIKTGSVIVDVSVPPSALRVGDVITYDRADTGQRYTHRIFKVSGKPAQPTFVTKGDANPVPDAWTVKYNGPGGKVVLAIPYLGYFSQFTNSSQGHTLFLVVPALLFLTTWLWQIWRPRADLTRQDRELPEALTPRPSAPPSAEVDPNLPASSVTSLPLRQ
ncbi:MAG: signal peptidase I [Chloroflexota bacterium]